MAQHIAWRELPFDRSRALLDILDARHRLRTDGILVPIGPEPYDVMTPWTTSYRVVQYLLGEDRIDPEIAALGGIVSLGLVRHSQEQHAALDSLRGWIGSTSPATVVLEGPFGSGRRTAVAMAAAPRRALAVDFSRVAPRRAEHVLGALRREALLLDAMPVIANLDELWSKLNDEIKNALMLALDALHGHAVITVSTPGLELRPERRACCTLNNLRPGELRRVPANSARSGSTWAAGSKASQPLLGGYVGSRRAASVRS